MRNISQDVIASTPIMLFSPHEQRQIAARLKAQLTEIERLPQRLLAQAFKTQGVGDESAFD
ncbi:hypothetical protein [Azonexus sp.]|uniref:hypothetical protein n=1 Tax=Azonexus sp. TaxID=1872668 RepID=UPI0039E4668D